MKKKNICDEKQGIKKRCAHKVVRMLVKDNLHLYLEHKKTRSRPNMKTQDKIW